MPQKPVDISCALTLNRKVPMSFYMGTSATRRVGGVQEGEHPLDTFSGLRVKLALSGNRSFSVVKSHYCLERILCNCFNASLSEWPIEDLFTPSISAISR